MSNILKDKRVGVRAALIIGIATVLGAIITGLFSLQNNYRNNSNDGNSAFTDTLGTNSDYVPNEKLTSLPLPYESKTIILGDEMELIQMQLTHGIYEILPNENNILEIVPDYDYLFAHTDSIDDLLYPAESKIDTVWFRPDDRKTIGGDANLSLSLDVSVSNNTAQKKALSYIYLEVVELFQNIGQGASLEYYSHHSDTLSSLGAVNLKMPDLDILHMNLANDAKLKSNGLHRSVDLICYDFSDSVQDYVNCMREKSRFKELEDFTYPISPPIVIEENSFARFKLKFSHDYFYSYTIICVVKITFAGSNSSIQIPLQITI